MGRSPEEGIKAPVKTSTTGNITLAGTGQTLNGVVTGTKDRVLAKDQTNPAENGTYNVGPDAWERTTDMNRDEDMSPGMLIVDSNTLVVYNIQFTGPWTPDITATSFVVLIGSMPTQITLTSPNVIDLVDVDVALITGALAPATNQHLEYDLQSIQSKSDATTAAPLFLNPLGSYVQAPQFVAGDPGLEAAGITIGGILYQSALKASDIGGTNVAAFIMHRHHATLPAILVGSRTKGSTDAHVVVADNDTLLAIMAVGWDGTDYEQGAQIRFQVDGVPGDNDMPGRIVFLTTPDGATIPVEQMRISEDGTINAVTALTIAGTAVSVVGHTHLEADITDLQAYALDSALTAHTGDATIHFTQAAISITESQVSDLGNYTLVGHTHLEADITDLQNYSLVGHIHAPVTSTTAALVDAANAINTTTDKVAGYEVWNTTTGAPVWAVGSADADDWHDATGSIAHDPA